MQLVIFLILDWKTEQLLNPSFRFDKGYSINVDLNNAHSFSLSYNNRYLAFVVQNYLEVLDLLNNQLVFCSLPAQESTFLGFKWFPDRNGLVYLIGKNQNPAYSACLYSLDLEAILSSDSKSPFIPRLDRKINLPITEIIKIDMSTYTNNLYILYRDQNKNNKLINIDIMKNINRLEKDGEIVQNMSVSNKFGTLYIQSQNSNKGYERIYSMKGREWNLLTNDTGNILLGSQGGLLYIGKIEYNTLQEIYQYPENLPTAIPQKEAFWKGNIPLNYKDIIISTDQKIILQGTERLDMIFPEGQYISNKISDQTLVLSPTGKMYLEILPASNKYFWRAI